MADYDGAYSIPVVINNNNINNNTTSLQYPIGASNNIYIPYNGNLNNNNNNNPNINHYHGK